MLIVYFLFFALSLPDKRNPWCIQLFSFTATDSIYENTVEINTSLEEESFPSTGPYTHFTEVQGVYQNKRIYRVCAGAFPSRDEAMGVVNTLTSRGHDCFPKKLFVEEAWESVEFKEDKITLGSDHIVDVFDNGQISSVRERAYIQPEEKYAALVYSNWTGFEGEGENLYLLDLESFKEKLVLIDMQKVLPYFWFSDDNGVCFLITELICGGTEYSNEIVIIDCENAEIVARHEHCVIGRYCEEENILYLNSLSTDETVVEEVVIDLKEYFK